MYDTHSSETNSNNMATYLNSLSADTIILFAVYDTAN